MSIYSSTRRMSAKELQIFSIGKLSQLQEIEKMIEGMNAHSGHKDLKTGKEWTDSCCLIDDQSVTEGRTSSGYNQALTDLLSKLKELRKEE